jgi:NDP-mannose synthase
MSRAVLLVGGKGTRLHPYTAHFPKPLVPLGDTPILEVLLWQLARAGITDITLAVGHLSELIEAYLSRRRSLLDAISLTYVHEDEPLGTAGALRLIEPSDRPFLVMNGDVLTDLDFAAFLAAHTTSGAALTIATHRREVAIDLGVIETDAAQRVIGYVEKPRLQYAVSMGIYAYSAEAVSLITPGERLDFPDLVLRLLGAGRRVDSAPFDGLWLDIGRPDDYAAAQELVESSPEVFGVG